MNLLPNKFAISLLCFLIFAGTAFAKDQSKELYEAVMFQDLPKIQNLISAGADVNYRENSRSILGWASQSGNLAVVETLLKAGAKTSDVDGVGHTPLVRAIETQHVDIVRALINAKADPNVKNSEGESCLMMAVHSQKPEIVKAIIDAGAD